MGKALEGCGRCSESGTKPWECEQLRRQEEALPDMSVEDLKKVAVAVKQRPRVDGFHPKIPLDLSDELCEETERFCMSW